MKSSLMVEDDRMCTCQEGNQLKLKKKKKQRREVRRKRGVRNKKKIAACMSHQDTFAIKVL